MPHFSDFIRKYKLKTMSHLTAILQKCSALFLNHKKILIKWFEVCECLVGKYEKVPR